MFRFVIRHLGFLKFIPLLAKIFDHQLRLWTLIINYPLAGYLDDIEEKVSKWEAVETGLHKYGGLQFNYKGKEIGHIHSNGLMDIRLSRKIKEELMREGEIKDHHSFKKSGWISFYIHKSADAVYAVKLLRISYDRLKQLHPVN